MTPDQPYDCIIIGGGPAGLTASVYLARFYRSVLVIDNNSSRAAYIPITHNYPGFPDGIKGTALLKRLREQAAEYGVQFLQATATDLTGQDGSFCVQADDQTLQARKIILATGIVDEKPDLPNCRDFIYSGGVRFCPICDGYEVTDQRIAVMGPLRTAIRKALFLRTFSAKITILSLDKDVALTPEETRLLNEAGIAHPTCCVVDLATNDPCIIAEMADGRRLEFDTLYPAMGARVRSELAISLGANHTKDGCVCTDDHHQTNIPGLYAIGDLSTELHQISVATGHAALVATHVHNFLVGNYR